MSELRLIVREAARDWSGIMHAGSVDRAIAALSADPVTLTELSAACARYEKPVPGRSFFASLSAGLCDEPYDAGIVVIDLAARVVAVDSTYSSPGPVGAVNYHDGESVADTRLRYHLDEDWLFFHDRFLWQAAAQERRREREARPVLDARSVLYGRPMLEFVARESFSAFAGRQLDVQADRDAVKQIHAAWLLTPRDDLNGSRPREVLLAKRGHLSWESDDQSHRWSLLGEAPPGLDKSSFAYLHGGFGTHELVQYYELIRELLYSCRGRLIESGEPQPAAVGFDALASRDFLTSEVPRLESLRDEWLDTPDPELHGRTPRSVIERERVRLPEAMSGHDAMVDPDCPCCRMLADLPGPAFWSLDGCNMDDEFAFDITHLTLEEWEAERREWEESYRRYEAEAAERRRRSETEAGPENEREGSVWSSSFATSDAGDQPMSIRLFGIGCRLSEVIEAVRGDDDGRGPFPQARELIDRLNRDFGNLREILQNTEPSVATSLIEPVIDRFTESLDAVAALRIDLAAKCESLAASVVELPKPVDSELM